MRERVSLWSIATSAREIYKSWKVASPQITGHIFWSFLNRKAQTVSFSNWNFQLSHVNAKYPGIHLCPTRTPPPSSSFQVSPDKCRWVGSAPSGYTKKTQHGGCGKVHGWFNIRSFIDSCFAVMWIKWENLYNVIDVYLTETANLVFSVVVLLIPAIVIYCLSSKKGWEFVYFATCFVGI